MEKFSTIPEMFFNICDKLGDSKPVILHKQVSGGEFVGVNYEELRNRVECFALGLMELGIHRGDHVGIVSENRLEWVISDLAITCMGAVDVPIFPTHTAKQEEYIFSDAGVVAIIVSNNFQLAKVLEFKDRLPDLRHVIVMNDEYESSDVTVKSMSELMERGKEIKSPEECRKILMEKGRKVSPDDMLTIIYTSGTTGNPKGVMLTHRNVCSNIVGFLDVIEFTPADTFLSFLPMCHSYERATGYYGALSQGSTIAIAESVETVGANILEVKPTLMTTVPRLLETIKKKIYNNIHKEPASKQKIFNWAVKIAKKHYYANEKGKASFFLKSQYKIADKMVFSKIREKTGGRLRFFVSGGAALAPEVCEFFLSIGINVLEGYGLTESSPVLAVNRQDNVEIGTVGQSLVNVEIKIADDGEILARGPNIMKGYWNDKLATEKAIDEEGWLYTGDVGFVTERGNIKITDRKKNIFVNSGGKNIAPQPIENLLSQSKYIEHVVLIGDRREFCTALITPSFEQLAELADGFEIKYDDKFKLINNDKIVQHIKNEIDYMQKDLAKFERVRRFRLLSQPFTIENGELSPKLSIRRHVVEKKYADFIDKMYRQ